LDGAVIEKSGNFHRTEHLLWFIDGSARNWRMMRSR